MKTTFLKPLLFLTAFLVFFHISAQEKGDSGCGYNIRQYCRSRRANKNS